MRLVPIRLRERSGTKTEEKKESSKGCLLGWLEKVNRPQRGTSLFSFLGFPIDQFTKRGNESFPVFRPFVPDIQIQKSSTNPKTRSPLSHLPSLAGRKVVQVESRWGDEARACRDKTTKKTPLSTREEAMKVHSSHFPGHFQLTPEVHYTNENSIEFFAPLIRRT